MPPELSKETAGFIDPFWLEHRDRILKIGAVLGVPKTTAGEEVLKEALYHPIFTNYIRISPVFSSLIALMEYDEIYKKESVRHFSEPQNQRIIIRALNLIVEDNLKFPYVEGENNGYEDYRGFFEGMLSRTAELDKQIQAFQGTPNFVNSLVMIFCQEAAKLKGVTNFYLKVDRIRAKIAGCLPQLARSGNGKELSEIKYQFEISLAD